MIKEALEYLMNEAARPAMTKIDGENYSSKPLHRISYKPKAEPIKMSTLSSLIDYIQSDTDSMYDSMIIHVMSPTHVEMYSELDDERNREHIVTVDAQVPEFLFNTFIEHEKFCINLQAKFIHDPNTDRALIQKFAGTVEAGTVSEYGDDGATQKATIKTGIASKGEAIVPNPVKLKAYRTFIEVDQPVSQYIFRLKQDKYDGVVCALFEADGGAWKLEAMQNIKAYLEEQLSDFNDYKITVIS